MQKEKKNTAIWKVFEIPYFSVHKMQVVEEENKKKRKYSEPNDELKY